MPLRRRTNESIDLSDQQQQSVTSIPAIYEQQLMNERLLCIQQMMASGQNFASMFDDNLRFAQQITAAAQQQESEATGTMSE